MHFISEDLENYAALHSENEPEILRELSKETHLKTLQPRMISGHFQGRFLSLISKLIAPKNILEIGTFTGYSTLCLAEGLSKGGQLHTIDINEELEYLPKKYFEKSDFKEQIIMHIGSGLDIIPKLNHTFDLAFIDADKENYLNYFELILPKMSTGGVILSDNVLWSGKVLQEVKANDKSTKALMAYNEFLKQDTRVETVLLPIRDGLTMSRVL